MSETICFMSFEILLFLCAVLYNVYLSIRNKYYPILFTVVAIFVANCEWRKLPMGDPLRGSIFNYLPPAFNEWWCLIIAMTILSSMIYWASGMWLLDRGRK